MRRAVYVALLVAVVEVAGFGALTPQASAAVPGSAVAKASCTRSGTAVNCRSYKEAKAYANAHCSKSKGKLECRGVGRDCNVQDEGIVCAHPWRHARSPKGGVAAGAGGTPTARSVPLLLAGSGLLGSGLLGLGVLLVRRRRATRP